MGFEGFISGLASSPLANKQAKKLAAERARALAADPDLPQKEFQRAREGLLGKDFGSQPAGEPCVPCMANAKAQRQDMDQVEHARLAKHVYVKYNPDAPEDLKAPPPGFLEPTAEDLAQLGISPASLAPENTDFRAAV